MTKGRVRRILGIDFGKRRIGVAISDPTGTIATGMKTIENDPCAYGEIARIVTENDVSMIVVGYPLTLKGEASKKAAEVRDFLSTLKEHVNVPIRLQDERFTSKEALSMMIDMNTTRKQRREKGKIDEIAAAIILQSFLNRRKFNEHLKHLGREQR